MSERRTFTRAHYAREQIYFARRITLESLDSGFHFLEVIEHTLATGLKDHHFVPRLANEQFLKIVFELAVISFPLRLQYQLHATEFGATAALIFVPDEIV